VRREAVLLAQYARSVSALEYDRTTLDPRDLSYARQLAYLVEEGWELEEADEEQRLRYLRRHRRIEDIQQAFTERGQRLTFALEDDGTWTALIQSSRIPESSAATPGVGGTTPLEAAEAALDQLKPLD
jgi:hypothetical protein